MKTDRERWADQYFTQQRNMEDQLNQEAVQKINRAISALASVGELQGLAPNQLEAVVIVIQKECERCITTLRSGNFYLPER